MKTIYWHPTGLKISYGAELLRIEDLNPERYIQYKCSRKELFLIGLRTIWIALTTRRLSMMRMY